MGFVIDPQQPPPGAFTVCTTQPMPWNYETGKEEFNPYPERSVYKPDLVKEWREAEEYTLKRVVQGGVVPRLEAQNLILAWEKAEGYIIMSKFQDLSKMSSFRNGYIAWLEAEEYKKSQQVLPEASIDQLPMINRIIAKGFRELAKDLHPDVGGNAKRFDELREAKANLDRIVREVEDLLSS